MATWQDGADIRVALSVASIAAADGGPSRSVPALSEALARQGVTTTLFSCTSTSSNGEELCTPSGAVQTYLARCNRRSIAGLAARPFRSVLRSVLVREQVQLL